MRYFQYYQCSGPQKLSKLRFSKCLQKIWTKNQNLIVKNKHNVGLKHLDFCLTEVVLSWKKHVNFFFKYFSIIPKKFFGFLIGKQPLLFVFQTLVELCPFITSYFWGLAHWSYRKDHKKASNSLSTYQAFSKFWVGKKIDFQMVHCETH